MTPLKKDMVYVTVCSEYMGKPWKPWFSRVFWVSISIVRVQPLVSHGLCRFLLLVETVYEPVKDSRAVKPFQHVPTINAIFFSLDIPMYATMIGIMSLQ